MKRLIGIACLALLFWQQIASAALVVIDFNFHGVDMDNGAPGTADVTFRAAFDANADDTDASANVGVYPAELTLLSGGTISSTKSTFVTINNDVDDGLGNIVDQFRINTSWKKDPPDADALVTVDGRPLQSADLTLSALPPDMLANDFLPMDVSFASKATAAFIVLQDVDVDTGRGFGTPEITYDVTAGPLPVPEPSTYGLMLVGLAGTLWALRARRN